MRYNLSKKRGNGVKKNICIVVLLLFVLGLGGYLCYDKLLKKENKNNDNLTEEKISIDDRYKNFIDNYKVSIDTKKSELKKEIDECNKTNGECENYSEDFNIKKYFSCPSSEKYFSQNGCTIDSSYNVNLVNNKLTISYDNEELQKIYGEKYLIASDVWNFEMIQSPGNGSWMVFFIKTDGSVGYAAVEDVYSKNTNEKWKSEKFEIVNNYHNLKNIVDIKEVTYDYYSHILFIDIDGNGIYNKFE